MHFQVGDGMAKLVRCGLGAIIDVVVDLRRGSPTFGEWEAFRLDDENLHSVYCPIGFAHGFCVVSESADVLYLCSAYYSDETERGIAFDDPDVGIEWPDVELIPPSATQTRHGFERSRPSCPLSTKRGPDRSRPQ